MPLSTNARLKQFVDYGLASLGVALLLVPANMLLPIIGYRAVGFVILIGVAIIGTFASIGPTLFAAFLSAAAWNFFFIPPRFTFAVSQPEDILMCITYLTVATIVGVLTTRLKGQENLVREREKRTNLLYQVSMDISTSQSQSEYLYRVKQRIENIVSGKCTIDLDPSTVSRQKAYPIKTGAKHLGNIFVPTDSIADHETLEAIANILGIALEKDIFEKNMAEATRLRQSEELHQTLLNSVSHEIRTPLTVVMASATAMNDQKISSNPGAIQKIATELEMASTRLNRVIENLLDMSRLNSGVLTLNLDWHDVDDLIGVTTQKLKLLLGKHDLVLKVEEHLPLVKMDFRFMEHALANLIQNASMYSNPKTKITVAAFKRGDNVIISVSDEGPGISQESQPRVFDKFYRAPGTPTGGTGLGLSIVKSIVEAHSGQIRIAESTNRGSTFELSLPVNSLPQMTKLEEEV